MSYLTFLLLLLHLSWLSIASATVGPTGTDSQTIPTNIIFDSDFGGDADDLGALIMLHHYADEGLINLLGVASWSNETYATKAIDAVNRYYGRSELPIGVRDVNEWVTEWNYSRAIAEAFPYSIKNVSKATPLYRKLLSQQPDNSVVIVTVGPLANIRNLLVSKADKYSNYDGKTLVTKKVKEFVIMGGFINLKDTVDKPEWNFDGNMPGVTKFVLETIENPITFSGYSVGLALSTGKQINDFPKNTPLYIGYKFFSEFAPWVNHLYQGEIIDNPSYDQTAVIFAAIGGVDEYWELSKSGTLTANSKGIDSWKFDKKGNHRFLILNSEEKQIENTKNYIANTMMYKRK